MVRERHGDAVAAKGGFSERETLREQRGGGFVSRYTIYSASNDRTLSNVPSAIAAAMPSMSASRETSCGYFRPK